MKPTKSSVFCKDCRKSKILFETEKKALNFIKFNSNEILEETGKCPTRAYYCEACCGWHVTSNSIVRNIQSPTSRIINQFVTEKNKLNEMRKVEHEVKMRQHAKLSDIENRIDAVRKQVEAGDYERSKILLDIIEEDMDVLNLECGSKKRKANIMKSIDNIKNILTVW